MWLRDKDKRMTSKLLFSLSAVGAFLALVGALGSDIYLASTQWLLVSAVLGVWAIYLLLEAEFRS